MSFSFWSHLVYAFCLPVSDAKFSGALGVRLIALSTFTPDVPARPSVLGVHRYPAGSLRRLATTIAPFQNHASGCLETFGDDAPRMPPDTPLLFVMIFPLDSSG